MIDVIKEVEAARKALAPAVKKLRKLLELRPKDMPVGKVADLLYDVREVKSLVSHLVDPLVEDILTPTVKALEEHFIMTLAAGEASGVQGAHSRVQVTPYAVPVFEEGPDARELFLAFVFKTRQFDLLKQDIINRDAVRERWDDKKQVKGITVFHTKKVSCTKLNGKGKK